MDGAAVACAARAWREFFDNATTTYPLCRDRGGFDDFELARIHGALGASAAETIRLLVYLVYSILLLSAHWRRC